MSSFERCALVVFGTVEFVLRAIVMLLLVVSILGLIVLVDEVDAREFLQPYCFTLLKHDMQRHDELTRRQRRKLAYQKALQSAELDHLRERESILQRTVQLEGELRNSPPL